MVNIGVPMNCEDKTKGWPVNPFLLTTTVQLGSQLGPGLSPLFSESCKVVEFDDTDRPTRPEAALQFIVTVATTVGIFPRIIYYITNRFASESTSDIITVSRVFMTSRNSLGTRVVTHDSPLTITIHGLCHFTRYCEYSDTSCYLSSNFLVTEDGEFNLTTSSNSISKRSVELGGMFRLPCSP